MQVPAAGLQILQVAALAHALGKVGGATGCDMSRELSFLPTFLLPRSLEAIKIHGKSWVEFFNTVLLVGRYQAADTLFECPWEWQQI